MLYNSVHGVRSAVLRLTNTYGPRLQVRTDRQSFIGIMIRQALRGEGIRVFGTGEQIREFNYVDDVVSALLLAATTDACIGRVWNLGASWRYSLLEFVSLLSEFCEVQSEVVPFPEDRKLIDIGDYYGDYSSFAKATGWQPEVDLREGLRRTIAFMREHAEIYWK